MNKNKKVFSMILVFMGMICVLCMTGCNFSCFGFKCSNVNNDDFKFVSVAVPGLGGCLSPGKGCNSCLYTDSCICSCGNVKSSDTETLSLMGCNQVFYGSCLGCGTSPRAVYNGCIYSPSVKGYASGSVAKKLIKQNRCVIIKKKYWS